VSKCLRCGAGAEWLQGAVRAEDSEGVGLLREAEGLLCDPQGGQVSNELAARIREYFVYLASDRGTDGA
jgi:hypothetical protein